MTRSSRFSQSKTSATEETVESIDEKIKNLRVELGEAEKDARRTRKNKKFLELKSQLDKLKKNKKELEVIKENKNKLADLAKAYPNNKLILALNEFINNNDLNSFNNYLLDVKKQVNESSLKKEKMHFLIEKKLVEDLLILLMQNGELISFCRKKVVEYKVEDYFKMNFDSFKVHLGRVLDINNRDRNLFGYWLEHHSIAEIPKIIDQSISDPELRVKLKSSFYDYLMHYPKTVFISQMIKNPELLGYEKFSNIDETEEQFKKKWVDNKTSKKEKSADQSTIQNKVEKEYDQAAQEIYKQYVLTILNLIEIKPSIFKLSMNLRPHYIQIPGEKNRRKVPAHVAKVYDLGKNARQLSQNSQEVDWKKICLAMTKEGVKAKPTAWSSLWRNEKTQKFYDQLADIHVDTGLGSTGKRTKKMPR